MNESIRIRSLGAALTREVKRFTWLVGFLPKATDAWGRPDDIWVAHAEETNVQLANTSFLDTLMLKVVGELKVNPQDRVIFNPEAVAAMRIQRPDIANQLDFAADGECTEGVRALAAASLLGAK